jgi:hypothetical protein
LYAAGAGSTGTFTSIELFKGNTLIDSKPFSRVIEFTDLLYFNTYTIVAKYTVIYDNDSSDVIVVTSSFDVTTKAKEGTPEVSFSAIYPTGSGVLFDITEIDPQDLGSIKEINIYDSNFVLIDTLENTNDRAFFGLVSNSNYRLEIVYEYDLNDDFGPQTFSVYSSFRTNPLVIFNGISIFERSEAIMFDDIIILDIAIDNRDIVQFSRVLINDVWFNVTSYNLDRIRVEVNIETFKTLGAFTLNVQEIEGIHNGIRYNYRLNRNNLIDINICEAWSISEGENTKVAVVDTGIELNHTDCKITC